MKHYDVVIVGAGPAGLRCAEILGKSGKKVLLLEKKAKVGDKICAGGITSKTLEIIDIPDDLFELKINRGIIKGPRVAYHIPPTKEPFLFIVDRMAFGQWQLKKLDSTTAEIRLSAQVTGITAEYVEINRQQKYSYTWLVGADGAASIVRRFLGIPVKKQLVTLQYHIPAEPTPSFEIHLNNRYFKSGYGWVFPHKNYLTVGCLADPHHIPVQKLKNGFRQWLKKEDFDLSQAVYQSFPINYDYRGYRFGNVFLSGEAAGLASGLSGEGIYAALLSGEETARMILQPGYPEEKMKELLHYKEVQDRFLKRLQAAGIFRQAIFKTLTLLMYNKRFNRKVTDGFS
jgi:geranylgeranyl reductase family protein